MSERLMKAVGETECVLIEIPNGQSVYVYTFTDTYENPPQVQYECGNELYELDVTTTQATITMSHSNGVSGHLCVFIQDNL
jgi:hypothetical protein